MFEETRGGEESLVGTSFLSFPLSLERPLSLFIANSVLIDGIFSGHRSVRLIQSRFIEDYHFRMI